MTISKLLSIASVLAAAPNVRELLEQSILRGEKTKSSFFNQLTLALADYLKVRGCQVCDVESCFEEILSDSRLETAPSSFGLDLPAVNILDAFKIDPKSYDVHMASSAQSLSLRTLDRMRRNKEVRAAIAEINVQEKE